MAPSDPDDSSRHLSSVRSSRARDPKGASAQGVHVGADAAQKSDGWEGYQEEDPWVTAPDLKPAPSPAPEPQERASTKQAVNLHDPHQFDVPSAPAGGDASEVTFCLRASIGGQPRPEQRFVGYPRSIAVRIGRGESNEMVIVDPSVSREHAELRMQEGAIVLRDLGSGNGTFVGGARVEETKLSSGASFLVGQVEIRVDVLSRQESALPAPPGDALAAPSLFVPMSDGAHNALPDALGTGRPPPGPSRVATGLKLLSVAGLVGTSLVAGLFATGRLGPRAEARRLSAEGTQALARNDLERARDLFKTGEALAPKEREILKLKRLVTRASAHQALLKKSLDALQAGQYGEAERLAGQIEEGFAFDAAQDVLKRSTEAQHRMLIAVHADLEAGRTAEGLETAVRLAAQAPGNQAAQALVLEVQQKQARDEQASVRSQRRRVWSPQPRPQPNVSPDVARALTFARAGNFASAQALLRGQLGREAQEAARALEALAEAYEGGLLEHRGKRAFAAIKTLGRAKTEAERLLGPSWLTTDIDQKMADMYYVLGVQAFGGRNFAEARASFLQATELCRGHALSLQKLREFEVRAVTLLGEAEALGRQDAGRVRSLLSEVMVLTGGQGPSAERARALLKVLT